MILIFTQPIIRLFIYGCCGIAFLFPPHINSADNSSPAQLEVKVVTEVLPPYQFLDENSQPAGYAVDVIRHLFDKIKLDVKLEFYPWPRAYRIASNAENVVIFSLARTQQREPLFHWVGKLYREEYALYQLANKPLIKASSLEQLMKYSVGVNRESPNDQFLTNQNFPYIECTSDIGQTVKMFYENRVDLLFGSDFALKSQVKKFGYDAKQLEKIYRVPELDADLYIGVSLESDPQLIRSLQKNYLILQQDGTLLSLQKKWQL